mmetsp:Transcript_101777/g.180469  ORF Transcript_101777/g.180469 Transcript_101777/m.180469 type:complete len:826 (+) Transcript_101777:69-2546(+)
MKQSQQKSSSGSHQKIVIFLLGLTVCYQIVYQGIMRRALQNEAAAADEECAGSGPFASSASNSPACLEVQLFRSWQQEELQFIDRREEELRLEPPINLLEDNRSKMVVLNANSKQNWDQLPGKPKSSPTVAIDGKARQQAPLQLAGQKGESHDGNQNGWSPMTEWAANLVGLQRRLQARGEELERKHRLQALQRAEHEAEWRRLEFDRLEKEVLESLNRSRHTVSPFAKDLMKAQQKLEDQLKALELNRTRRHKRFLKNKTNSMPPAKWHKGTFQEEIDRLERVVLESLKSSSNHTSPWAKNLMATQKRLEEELKNLDSTRAHSKSKFLHNATNSLEYAARERQVKFDYLEKKVLESLNQSRNTISPWAKDLIATQQKLQDQLEKLDSKRLPRLSGLHNGSSNSSSHTVMLSNTHVRNKAFREAAAARRAKIKKEAAEQKAKLEGRLAELAAARQVWETELLGPGMHRPQHWQLRQSEASPEHPPGLTTAGPALRGQVFKTLSWTAAQTGHHSQKGSAVVVRWQELRGARWAGMIPKVACIAVIPSGRAAKARMPHFIDNFRRQEYEGPRQLVLVYHHADEEAKQLVNTYADGSYIKGAASFGNGDLPSTVAFRYGAWVSSGDVVARWDFDHFHHPWRLSMQVRALALKSKAACFFRHPAAPNSKEQQSAVASSMLGERTWMHKYWHPLLSTEAVLEGFNGGDMVEVDVLTLQRTAPPSDKFQSSTFPAECFESASDAQLNEDRQRLVHEGMVAKFDSEMGDTYSNLLTKYSDVNDKFLALCAEEAESVGGQDATRSQQLGRLATVRSEIKKHLEALTTLWQEAA